MITKHVSLQFSRINCKGLLVICVDVFGHFYTIITTTVQFGCSATNIIIHDQIAYENWNESIIFWMSWWNSKDVENLQSENQNTEKNKRHPNTMILLCNCIIQSSYKTVLGPVPLPVRRIIGTVKNGMAREWVWELTFNCITVNERGYTTSTNYSQLYLNNDRIPDPFLQWLP